MIVRELLTRIGYRVDRKTEQKATLSFKKLRDQAGKLGIALSVGAVALGFKRILDAASDVEETMNVVTTAFEDQTASVLQWAKESGEAAGRSEFAMREYAATVGAVVGPTLGSAEATAQLSTDMAQLAVDLGSFFNTTDDDALQALRAGLIGQAEPLLRFGVAMNVAALDAFALQQGIGKTTKQMSQAEKIQLRYAFIMDQTVKAQGDAEKTAAGFANQAKRLMGNLRDIAVAIGQELLPGAADTLATLNDIAKVIKGPLARGFRTLGRVLDFVRMLVVGLGVVFVEAGGMMQAAILGLLGAVLLLKAPFVITFLVIAALVVAAILIVEDLWLAITEGKGVIAGVVNEFIAGFTETGSVIGAIGSFVANILNFWIEKIFGVSDATGKAAKTMSNAFRTAFEFIGTVFAFVHEQILNGLIELAGFMTDHLQPVVDAVMDALMGAVGLVSDLGLGDLAARFGFGGPERITAPGSPAAAAAAAANAQASQTNNININAPGNDGPGIANALGPVLDRAAVQNRRTSQQLLLGAKL
jgi:hypothetical protein